MQTTSTIAETGEQNIGQTSSLFVESDGGRVTGILAGGRLPVNHMNFSSEIVNRSIQSST